MSAEDIQAFRDQSRELDEGERRVLADAFGRRIDAAGNGLRPKHKSLVNPATAENIDLVDDVDAFVRDFAKQDAKVSEPLKEDGMDIEGLSKGKLAKRVFTDLNLSKDADVVARAK